MSYSRAAKVETWITSDGRAYFVQLVEAAHSRTSDVSNDGTSSTDEARQPGSEESALQWQGVCIHDVEPPRWVQKQKAPQQDGDDAEFDYIDSRRAVCVAANSKFSVVATGTQRYVIHWFCL